jgi:hypothetical protein
MTVRSLSLFSSVAGVLYASLACAAGPVAPATSAQPHGAAAAATAGAAPALVAEVPLEVPHAEPSVAPSGNGEEVAPPVPSAPAAGAAPQVVLADELPYRPSHLRELPHHAHHGKKKGRHGRPYHPAPGIVVDVSDAQGSADANDLQRTARSIGYWPFRHCYEEGLRRNQSLSGKVTLDVTVGATGAVERATMASATVKDESVALCVEREAGKLTLAPGKGTARLAITLSTGDEPVPEPPPATHAKELRDGLRASWPAVEKCYASELAKQPEAGGRLELRFTTHADGQVVDVAEGESRFADVDVTRCVLGVYRQAQLPPIHGGGPKSTWVYALHLESRR